MKLTPKLNKKESLLLLGHNGLIGSALLKQLKNRNYKNIITVEKKKLDLLNFSKIENFFKKKKTKKNNYCCSKSWRNCSKCKISF
jgi:GDP-L-fucose synthase